MNSRQCQFDIKVGEAIVLPHPVRSPSPIFPVQWNFNFWLNQQSLFALIGLHKSFLWLIQVVYFDWFFFFVQRFILPNIFECCKITFPKAKHSKSISSLFPSLEISLPWLSIFLLKYGLPIQDCCTAVILEHSFTNSWEFP